MPTMRRSTGSSKGKKPSAGAKKPRKPTLSNLAANAARAAGELGVPSRQQARFARTIEKEVKKKGVSRLERAAVGAGKYVIAATTTPKEASDWAKAVRRASEAETRRKTLVARATRTRKK